MKHIVAALVILPTMILPASAAGKGTQFWNLTGNIIDSFKMSPAGQDSFGANQCTNDKDGTVDPDERLRITGVSTGLYDIKLTDNRHRSCEAKNVSVTQDAVFSLSEKDIVCKK